MEENKLKKVTEPGPTPAGVAGIPGGNPRIDWSPLRTLEVGEAMDAPGTANLSSVAVQLSKMHKAEGEGGKRWTRKGRRIWRVV